MPSEPWKRGIYDNDYFSGAQVALYVGDVWVDEVTQLAFQVHQSRSPIYGYASPLFDDVSKGNVMVQGQFSINFKEAGYLWLVLNRYKKMMVEDGWKTPIMGKDPRDKIACSEWAQTYNIEQIVSDQELISTKMAEDDKLKALHELARLETQAKLAGFSSDTRATGSTEGAESIFESFENLIWNGSKGKVLNGLPVGTDTRRADDPRLNPFDIYITYGDYTGDDRIHHTIQCLSNVYILGNSKQVVIDGQPIQETYSFIAKDLI